MNTLPLMGFGYKNMHYDFFSVYKAMKEQNITDAAYTEFTYSGIFDLYLCLLCAGVTEDMLFSADNGVYRWIENFSELMQENQIQLNFDPSAAIYSGKHDLAKNLIRTSFISYEDIVVNSDCLYINDPNSECLNFIEKVTDKFRNEKHTEILTDLLTKDYINGGRCIFDYMRRYCNNEQTTCKELLDKALLEINDVDRIFSQISFNAYYMLNNEYDVNRNEVNKRVLEIMSRCAELGMTLKKFSSFNEILLPEYDDHGEAKARLLPHGITKLIGKKTDVCNSYQKYIDIKNRNKFLTDEQNDMYDSMKSCFADADCSCIEELEYIAIDFHKRYGQNIAVELVSPYDFFQLKIEHTNLFDFKLSKYFLENVYGDIKLLKDVLKTGMLSEKNIDEIVEYYARKVSGSLMGNSDYSIATKKLRQLNSVLKKYRRK